MNTSATDLTLLICSSVHPCSSNLHDGFKSMDLIVLGDGSQTLAIKVNWHSHETRRAGGCKQNHNTLQWSQFWNPPGHAKTESILDDGADH